MKKVLSLLLALAMTLAFLPVTVLATDDCEPNDTIRNAQEFTIGDTVNGEIPEKSDVDWYKFTMEESGRITLKMASYMQFYSLSVHDADGKQIWTVGDKEWDAAAGMRSDIYTLDLIDGTYHILVTGRRTVTNTNTYYQSTGEYVLRTEYVSANATETEPNNDIASADTLPLYGTIAGHIALNDRYDFYQIELPASGELILELSAQMQYAALILYDANGNTIWSDDDNNWDSSSGIQHLTFSHHLAAGIYYVRVSGDNRITNSNYGLATGSYTIRFNYTNANANEVEPNDSINSPQWIVPRKTIVGQIAQNDRKDFFKFTLTRKMKLIIDFTSYMEAYSLQLYNENTERIWYDDGNTWNSTSHSRNDTHEIDLDVGTYILCVTGDDTVDRDWGSYTGNYTFSLNTENPFTDVPAGCWYEAPVLWALENGVTSGSSETTFSPGDKCLRAHVVTFLWNAEKTPEPTAYTKSFSDVPTGAWYYKPVHWAVEHGITSGTSATKFGAGDVCSRYQVVFFLWKAAGSPEPKTTVNPFTDVNPGHFFYKAVLWAVENGITSGTSATTFGPTAPCNRAQVVTFLYAAYN